MAQVLKYIANNYQEMDDSVIRKQLIEPSLKMLS